MIVSQEGTIHTQTHTMSAATLSVGCCGLFFPGIPSHPLKGRFASKES